MKNRIYLASILLAATAIWLYAQTPTPSQDQMVEWLIPARPSNHPQTPTDEEKGRTVGRAEPVPEILQPGIDSALPAYQPRKDIGISGEFRSASSDVLPGLVKLWVGAFRKYYPDVTITNTPPYAGSLGAVELVKGNLDFVFVSRELKPDDIKGFKAKFGYDPLSVPICGGSYRHFGFLDAVAFFVNKDNPLEKIGFDQLDAILSRTHHRGGDPITKWGQLGLSGEWAGKPIHIYGIKPWNGFEEFVRQRVLSVQVKRGEWREDINYEKVVFPLAHRVAADRYGIGYSGVAYVDAGVKMLPLGQTKSGPFYAPTYENVARAAYPLSRVLYLNTNKAPSKALNPAIQEFVRFILSREGQQLVLNQALYVPLRANQAETSRALVN